MYCHTQYNNIVSILFRKCYLISPFLTNGNLLDAIQRHDEKLTANIRLKVLYQVCSAINYLHTPLQEFR